MGCTLGGGGAICFFGGIENGHHTGLAFNMEYCIYTILRQVRSVCAISIQRQVIIHALYQGWIFGENRVGSCPGGPHKKLAPQI